MNICICLFFYCVFIADTVNVIDYEYAGMNFAAFDLGNFFCEFSGWWQQCPDYGTVPLGVLHVNAELQCCSFLFCLILP